MHTHVAGADLGFDEDGDEFGQASKRAPRLADIGALSKIFARESGTVVLFGATGRLGRLLVHALLQVNEQLREAPPLELRIVSRDCELAKKIVDDQQPVRIRQRMLQAQKHVRCLLSPSSCVCRVH